MNAVQKQLFFCLFFFSSFLFSSSLFFLLGVLRSLAGVWKHLNSSRQTPVVLHSFPFDTTTLLFGRGNGRNGRRVYTSIYYLHNTLHIAAIVMLYTLVRSCLSIALLTSFSSKRSIPTFISIFYHRWDWYHCSDTLNQSKCIVLW